MQRQWAWISLIGIPASLWGCDHSKPDEGDRSALNVYLQHADSSIQWDHYLTWRDYDMCGPPTDENVAKAVYVWDGKSIGKGDAGLAAVLAQIAALPRGSRVLVYPSPHLTWQLGGSRTAPDPPFTRGYHRLAELQQRRRVQLIYAPFDHDRKLLPECTYPPYSQPERGVTTEMDEESGQTIDREIRFLMRSRLGSLPSGAASHPW